MDFSLQSGNQISLKRDEKQTPFSFMSRKGNGDVDYVNVFLISVSTLSLLISAGMYFYNASLTRSVLDKKTALNLEQTKIQDLPITEIRSLHKKLKYANEITSNYNIMDTMFSILGKSIEHTARYDTFSINKDNKTGTFSLTLTGETESYKSLVQQRNAFFIEEQAKYFTEPKIESFSLDKNTGKINFKFTSNLMFAGLKPDSGKLLFPEGNNGSSTSTQTTP